MPVKNILARLRAALGTDHVAYGSVTPAAQSAVAAVLARQSQANTWIFCADVRRQEEIAADLATWGVRAVVFPPLETIGEGEIIADPETLSERLEVLSRLAGGAKGTTVVAVETELEGRVAAPDTFRKNALALATKQRIDLAATEAALEKGGYEHVPKIFGRGQFARRGGILDIHSWQNPLPVRIELFGDEIESIREFQLDSQISSRALDRCEILIGDPDRKLVPLETYFAKNDARIAIDCDAPGLLITESGEDGVAFFPPGIDFFEAGDFVINEAKRTRFFTQIREWIAAAWQVVLVCNNEGEWERFGELARDNGLDVNGGQALEFLQGNLTAGFTCPAARLAVLSDAELFGRSSSQRARQALVRRERAMSARTVDFAEFEEGGLSVHFAHGCGRSLGMEKPSEGGDQLVMEFASDSRLYVPLDQAWQVSRYVGLGKRHPALSELGDGRWQRAKSKAERSIFE